MNPRFAVPDLIACAARLLRVSGLEEEKSAVVAEILVEGDLLGHDTHGLQLLGSYLEQLRSGSMTSAGEPETLSDSGACVAWNGRLLPGPWLLSRATDLACARAREHGVVTVTIRRSHHTACLAAYLPRAVDRDLAVLIAGADPSTARVAPHGGIRPVYSPNPIAAGWPTDGAPVLLDMSTSATSMGEAYRRHRRGEKFPGPWVIDAEGTPSDDPGVLFAEPPGALLPLGGLDRGHKGFALGLMVEMLTSALAGGARSDGPQDWSASVFLQVIDPGFFGGRDAFLRETGWLAAACRDSAAAAGGAPVRMPGQAALARRARALDDGLALHPDVLEALRKEAAAAGLEMPAPLA